MSAQPITLIEAIKTVADAEQRKKSHRVSNAAAKRPAPAPTAGRANIC